MASVKIDRKLNLIIPVVGNDGMTYNVFFTPLSRVVFDQHFEPIAKAFDDLFKFGLATAPRIAAKILKKAGEALGLEDRVTNQLIPEMKRGSMVIAPTKDGFETIPFDEAVARNLFDEEDVDNLENILSFFIVTSAIMTRAEAKTIVESAATLYQGQTSSLTPMGFANSMKTSMPEEDSTTKANLLSIPS